MVIPFGIILSVVFVVIFLATGWLSGELILIDNKIETDRPFQRSGIRSLNTWLGALNGRLSGTLTSRALLKNAPIRADDRYYLDNSERFEGAPHAISWAGRRL